MTTQQQSNSGSENSNIIPHEIIPLLPVKSPQPFNSHSEDSSHIPQISNSDPEDSHIPHEIIEKIFWSLPLDTICRSKAVCKEWNAILSSAEFWAQHPDHPYLMFCIDHPPLENILYSLATNTWNTIPMTFMPRYRTGLKYYASCRGIVLAGVGAYPQTLFVCNPLLRQFRQLPPTLSIELNSFTPKGIVFCEYQVCYKVVAIGPDHHKNKNVVEIYNSSNSSWKSAGKIPQRFTVRKGIEFCKSSFFCLVSHPKDLMVYCSIKEDVCKEMKFVRLPIPHNPNGTVHYNLVALGDSILLTRAIRGNRFNTYSEMSIWEFQMIDRNAEDNSSFSKFPWKEIARMPEPMCEEMGRHGWWYECVGVGDIYVCFRDGMSEEVVTYNLRDGSWKWLPPSPYRWVNIVHTITRVAMRLDFKL